MKIAISAAGPGLEAEAEPRFGRCPYFIIVDPETMAFEAMDNSAASAAGGAGIAAAQTIADKGVQAVLTGHCGPNAYQALSAAGVGIITGVSGKVKDVVQNYRLGKYKASDQANAPDHFGMGGSPGAGGGMNRGAGKGCGRGKGAAEPSTQSSGREQELQELKNQSRMMADQLAEIQRRIEELGKNN